MNLEQALAEVVTSTGPIGTLIVAAAWVMRAELRRIVDRIETLEKTDDEIRDGVENLTERVRGLESRTATPTLRRFEPTPQAGELLT